MQQKIQDFLFYTILLFVAYCLRITYGPMVSSLALPLWLYLGFRYKPAEILMLGGLSGLLTLGLFLFISSLAYPRGVPWFHPILAVAVGLVISLQNNWKIRIPALFSVLGMGVALALAQAEFQRAWRFWAWLAGIAALATLAFAWPRIRQRHLWKTGWSALVVYWYLNSLTIFLFTPADLSRALFLGLWRPAVIDVMLLNLAVLLWEGLQRREQKLPWHSRLKW